MLIVFWLYKVINLNSRNEAKSINAFNFSTLYTKLPHDKIRREKVNFILLNYFGAILVKEKIKGQLCLSE